MYKITKALITASCAVLMGCGGGSKEYIAPLYDVYPYSGSAHPKLECAMAIDAEDQSRICALGVLPLIGTESSEPTKQDIKDRLLVSHDWMGKRFMSLLDEMPADILLMLRSVTAVVIADNIRPSFYTTETAAIYLDPEVFWLTQEERKTISTEEDFRSGFSDGLNFTSLWRYLKPDGTLTRAPDINRKLEDVVFPLARLLYHELAHANTFLPPALHDSIDPSHKAFEAADAFAAQNASFLLQQSLPLGSELLKDLAFVSYRGEAASEEQVALSATEVGAALASDRANDDYAYVPFNDGIYYEDIAMLLEELMSKYHFDYDRELAYTNAANTIYCSDYLVDWGQTGRIGDTNVKEAARLAVRSLIPEIDLEDFIDNLPVPEQTNIGIDWCSPFYIEEATTKTGQEKPFRAINYDISPNKRSPHFH